MSSRSQSQIPNIDFELGTPTRVHQPVYDAIPSEGAISYSDLLSSYEKLDRSVQLEATFDEVLKHLEDAGFIEKKSLGATTYIRRRRLLLARPR